MFDLRLASLAELCEKKPSFFSASEPGLTTVFTGIVSVAVLAAKLVKFVLLTTELFLTNLRGVEAA